MGRYIILSANTALSFIIIPAIDHKICPTKKVKKGHQTIPREGTADIKNEPTINKTVPDHLAVSLNLMAFIEVSGK